MADVTPVHVTSPSHQAYQLLHVAYTVVPLVAGVDKFFHFLANWDVYLSPIVPRALGITAHGFMLGVGVIEVLVGLVVAAVPRAGGIVLGIWLCAVIANLLTVPAFFDIALRDGGLALGAFALARLGVDFDVV
jgi:hypothetical protein